MQLVRITVSPKNHTCENQIANQSVLKKSCPWGCLEIVNWIFPNNKHGAINHQSSTVPKME